MITKIHFFLEKMIPKTDFLCEKKIVSLQKKYFSNIKSEKENGNGSKNESKDKWEKSNFC